MVDANFKGCGVLLYLSPFRGRGYYSSTNASIANRSIIQSAKGMSFLFPVISLMAVQLRKPQMMPCVMLYENGMITMARKAGIASSSFDQLILVTGCTMNTPTSTRAGAVAIAGTTDNKGARNRNGKNNKAPIMAVNPVLPPSLIPTADSI
jgi:hypothetical protein